MRRPYKKYFMDWPVFGFTVFFLAVFAYADDGTYRSLVKTGGLFGAVLGIIGIGLAGYFAGKSYDSYAGWERYTLGAGQFYNRKRFRRDRPTYWIEEKTKRLGYIESLSGRMQTLAQLMVPLNNKEPQWSPSMGIEGLPEPLKAFFKKHKEKYIATLAVPCILTLTAANLVSL